MKPRVPFILLFAVLFTGWLAGSWSISAAPTPPTPKAQHEFGPMSSPSVSIQNSYIKALSSGGGRFLIGTTGGDPNTPNDNNKRLLYGYSSNVGSSFSTLRIISGGVTRDYRLGTTDWPNPGIAPVTPPASDGNRILTIWERDGVRVEERLYFAQNTDTGRLDTTAIEYTIHNNSGADVDAGLRVMLDVMVGENDGAPYFILGSGQVTRQSEWLGTNVPSYWISYESSTFDADSLKGRGQLAGGDATRPDRFVIADWPQVYDTVWNYGVDANDLVTNDSAAVLYYNPTRLGPGQSRIVRTYYGINRSGEIAQLELVGLEVTQAIQNLRNSVVLITDKPTYVRAHVRSTSGTVAGVTAELIGRRGGSDLGAQQPVRGGSITVPERPNRGALEDSFLFELPSDWRHGVVELEFRGINRTFNCDEPDSDGDEGNDGDCRVQMTFDGSPIPEMRFVGITWREGDTRHTPDEDEIREVAQEILTTFPISQLNWDSPYTIEPVFFAGRPSQGWQFARLNTMLSIQRKLDGCFSFWPVNCRRYYIGVLVDPPASGVVGMASDIPSDIAATYVGVDLTPSHEFGHAAGRFHTNCTGGEGGPANDFPYSGGRISQESSGNNAFYGLDVRTQSVHATGVGDLMGYCRPRWPSDWTYTHIRDHLVDRYDSSLASATAQPLLVMAGEEAVFVSGAVSLTVPAGEIHSLYAVDSPASFPAPTPGDYAIRLIGSQGELLAEYPFAPERPSEGANDSGLFSLALAWHPAARRIILLREGQEILSRMASGHPPTVNVLTPNGGETLGGESVVAQWSAGDPDGDPLRFAVQYSVDGGATWQTLVTDWPSLSYEIRLDTLAGTSQGRIRILASDGFFTARDQSAAVFQVERHAPRVTIMPSAYSHLYVGQQTVVLDGSAFDAESGFLAGAALTWVSDRAGYLGSGSSLSISASSLAEGNHSIELRAQDADGQVGRTSVPLTIYHQRPTLPASLSVSPGSLSFDLEEGGGQADWQTALIRNAGDGGMTWTATADQPWIRLSSSSGTAPTDILVTAIATGLAPGQYTGAITVSAATSNSPRSIAVSFVVRTPLVPRAFLPLAMRNHWQSPPNNWLVGTGLAGRTVLHLSSTNTICSTVFASTDGGAYRSYDGGKSWGPIFANTTTNTQPLSFDGLVDPDASLTPALAQCPTNPSILYLTTWGGGVHRSTDAGNSWQPHNGGLSDAWLYDLEVSSSDCGIVYAAANTGGVFKTTDGGLYWQAINNGLGNRDTRTLALAPRNANRLWVGTTNGVYRSSNGGMSWQAGVGLPGERVGVLNTAPDNADVVYAGLDSQGVYRSTDGGATWQQQNSGMGQVKVRALAIDPLNSRVVYAGRDDGGGVYRSVDGGANWTALNEGLSNRNIKSLWLDGGSCHTLLAGTTNGVWYFGP